MQFAKASTIDWTIDEVGNLFIWTDGDNLQSCGLMMHAESKFDKKGPPLSLMFSSCMNFDENSEI